MKKASSIFLTLILLISTLTFPASANATINANNNPVIDGAYADPDIDYFDHKYWIFPTTDGQTNNGWWSGTTFSAFSSEDMINWTNEGIVLDVKADSNEEAGTNSKGIQIAFSSWSDGSAWAPSIEKIGNKYFLFYVGKVKAELMAKYGAWIDEYSDDNGNVISAHYVDDKAIGVAVADSPTGPYVAYDEPILYGKQVSEKVFEYNSKYGTEYTIPSVIDPSVFIDKGVDANKDDADDIYISFGNWTPMLARIKVNDSQIEIDNSLFKPVKGVLFGWWQQDNNGFMESLVIFKRNDTYYFTWSVDGTASINYRVAYGTANKITNKVEYKGTLLQLDKSKDIYGTGHQSVLHNPINDKFYICYHRLQLSNEKGMHYNSNGELIETAEQGNYRETCIDEITFNASGDAYSAPTHKGTGSISVHKYNLISSKNATCTQNGSKTYKCSNCSKTYTKIINKKGHSYTSKVIAPTCTLDGYTKYTCQNCGKTYKSKYTKATGVHKYGTAKITKKATYASTGIKTQTCTICKKATKTTTIPKLKLAKPSKIRSYALPKGFKLSWKKVSACKGYEIQYSTNSSYKSAKKITISKNTTLTKSIKKLKANKKYYVRIRAYVVEKNKKYYSQWVKTSIKTKK